MGEATRWKGKKEILLTSNSFNEEHDGVKESEMVCYFFGFPSNFLELMHAMLQTISESHRQITFKRRCANRTKMA